MKFNEIVKKTSLAILTAGLLVGLADVKDFAPATVDASADTLSTFEMVGAEIRPDNAATTQKDETGIRFISRVDKSAYATLGTVTEQGTLLIPRKILGDDELVRGYADAVDLSTLGKSVDGGDYYEFRAALYGIPENSYLSGVVARSYIVANGVTYYTDEIERSVSWVANRALEVGGYDRSVVPTLRNFQRVTADTELKIDYVAGVPVRNSEPVNFTEEGETFSMEFTVLEDLDYSGATGSKRLYFGIDSAGGNSVGQSSGSCIFMTDGEFSYQGSGGSTSTESISGINIYKAFTAGNRVKAVYTYSTEQANRTFSVWVQTPADNDYVKWYSRIGVPVVQNAYMGLWDISGDYTTVFNNLTFKKNGVQTEALKSVTLKTDLDVERVYPVDPDSKPISVNFTGAGNISYGVSNAKYNGFNLGYNQTLVWEFDITDASMAAAIEFIVSEGAVSAAHGPREYKTTSSVMYRVAGTAGADWWGGDKITPQNARNQSNVFRTGYSYRFEYKTATSATASDATMTIYERATRVNPGAWESIGGLKNIKNSKVAYNVAGQPYEPGHIWMPMTGVKMSLVAISSGSATFTMANSKCYVEETGARVKNYTTAGTVTA